MSLRQALSAYAAAESAALVLPVTPAILEASGRLGKLFGESGKGWRPAENLDRISLRITFALEKGSALGERDLLKAPWCIWASAFPLSRKPNLVEKLLTRIVEVGRSAVYRALAAAWFHSFRVDGACLPQVGAFLKERADTLGRPWKEASETLDIFDAAAGQDAIVDAAMKEGCTPDDILIRIGFRPQLASGGYRERLYRLGLERIEREGGADPWERLRTLERWACANGMARFQTLKAPAVRAALRPFGDETPEEGLRDVCLDLVHQLLRDPRSRPGDWSECPEAAGFAARWLTDQALRLFFAAPKEQDRRIHRRAFWNALYRRGLIDDAWVVLESDGAGAARRKFGQNVRFGRFEGFQPGHCVLLLRVRGLTIAEWSHNKPCSIWDDAESGARPRLHRGRYSASELMKQYKGDDNPANLASQGVFWHHGDGRYLWQSRIADYLRQRRDLILDPEDYKVD
jgi:hypothetical protein